MEGGGGVGKRQWREGEVLIRDSGGGGGVDKRQWGRGRC